MSSERVTPDPAAETRAQPLYLTVPSEPSGVDVVEIWNALWKGKWLIAAIAFLCTAAGIAYSLAVTPMYQANVTLMAAGESQASGALASLRGLASLAGVNTGGGGNTERYLAMLKSKQFVRGFIRDNKLLPVLFSSDWDSKHHRWNSDNSAHRRDYRDGVKFFLKHVMFVTEDRQTGLITLAVQWTDPAVAAKWANQLVHRINKITRQSDIDESQQELDYLRKSLSKANLVELRQAIARVIQEQVNKMTLAQADTQYAFKIIDPAIVPKQRFRPRRTLIVVITAGLGVLLGLFVVLGRLAIRRAVARSKAAEH